jgi:hypothetical protein
LIFVANGGFEDAALEGFTRYIIVNAGGLTNFGPFWEANNTLGEEASFGCKGYNVNAYSLMGSAWARDYSTVVRALDGEVANGNMDGTDVDDWPDPNVDSTHWLPTPFTANGTTGSSQGDSYEAWTVAVAKIKSDSGGNGVQVYHQWDWFPCYSYIDGDKIDTESPVDYTRGYDRLSGAIDFKPTVGAIRTPRPTTFFDTGFWDYEINGMKSLGFNGLTWGVSGNNWEDSGDTPYFAHKIEEAYPNTPFLFEAVPLTSTGSGANKVYHPYGTVAANPTVPTGTLSGVPDSRYSVAGHWGFFKSFFTNDALETAAAAKNFETGGRNIKDIAFDPSRHEIHCVFDYGFLVRQVSNAPNWSVIQLKEAMIEAWQNGFIVSLCNLRRDGGTTAAENQDICAWVLELNTYTTSGGISTSAALDPALQPITRPENPAAVMYGY